MSDSLRQLARKLRLPEIVFLSGGPVLGGLFGCHAPALDTLPRFGLLVLLCGFGGLHVGIANDFFDARNRAAVEEPPQRGALWLIVSISCLGVCVAIGYVLGVVPIVLGIAACWMLYVAPPLRAKRIPVLSCSLHFLAGGLHFTLGYVALGGTMRDSLPLMAFFGLIIVSGQLCHEVQHREEDGTLGVRTNAQQFGANPLLLGSMMLIVLSDAYLLGLSFLGVLPFALGVGAVVSLPVYLFLWGQVYGREPTPESVGTFRRRYRLLYVALGLYFAVYLVLTKWA